MPLPLKVCDNQNYHQRSQAYWCAYYYYPQHIHLSDIKKVVQSLVSTKKS